MAGRLLVVQVAALGYDFFTGHHGSAEWQGLTFRPARSIFPALTCPVQATMRTGTLPRRHGMVFNGHFSRPLRRPLFWEQASSLVEGERVWQQYRASGKTVGMMFWQQSLGEGADVVVSPWPVHTHGGKLIDRTFSKPTNLYAKLARRLGGPFKLKHYWGPLASFQASQWIAQATAHLMGMDLAPDLLFTYLPHLDYGLQKHADDAVKARGDYTRCLMLLEVLRDACRRHDYDLLIYGDYAIGPVKRVLFPNRILLDLGLLSVRAINARLYPNLHDSRAFAVVDHECAHVYLQRDEDLAQTLAALESLGGRFDLLYGDELAARGLAHPHSGRIVMAGHPGTWFAYPWWRQRGQAPDYATHVDIHHKPGFDPCELFFGWPPFATSQNPARVHGSHGSDADERQIAWASTRTFDPVPETQLDLARALRGELARRCS